MTMGTEQAARKMSSGSRRLNLKVGEREKRGEGRGWELLIK